MFLLGCEKGKDVTGEIVNGPIASFTTSVKYVTHQDASTTAEITFNNYSSYSNRWLWKFENQGVIETDDINLKIVKTYPATDAAREYLFTLTAYSDVVISVDSIATFSKTASRSVIIKKP